MTDTLRFERFEIHPALRQVWVAGAVSPLGARAFDLLMLLIEHRSRVVPKDEIFDRVWPGLVVEDNNLSVQISALRRALGADAIATAPGRGYRFTAKATDQMAPPLIGETAGNLPAHAPPIYGREADLAQLAQAFDDAACVTVCGLAGIGKTALAKAAAQRLATSRRYPQGVWYVELANVQNADALVPTVCETLGIDLTSRQPLLRECLDHLRHLELLLVLDNCEHIIEAVSDLVAQLLASAERVHVLATSQEPFRVAGERVLRLSPLAVPASPDDKEARSFGAVRMLHERVRSALGSDFEPTDEEFVDLVEICRQLDGVPLALEFASARVPLLGLAGVRSRLHDRLRLLAGGTRGTHSRHRSLQAALEWSHQLLSLRTREIFHRLAVFPSGFSLLGAQFLLEAASESELLEHLSVLVERSLVTVQPGATMRYRMLETTRAFALDCLAAEADVAEWQWRHARAMSKLGLIAARERNSPWMWQEMPNARAALALAMSDPAQSEIAVTLATYTSVVLAAGGAIGEALDNLLRVQPLLADSLPAALVARYWHWLGRLGVEGRLPSSQCVEALNRADTLFTQLGEPRHRQGCQRHLAEAELRSGRLGNAESHLAAARALEGPSAPPADRMRRLRVEALVADARGEHQAALRQSQMALTIAETYDIDRYRLLLMSDMAWTHLQMGHADAAVAAFQDLLLHLDNSIRQGLARAHAASGLTAALIAAARFDEAARSAISSLRTLQQANLLRSRSDVFAWLAAATGHVQTAALLIGVGDAFCASSETERDAVSQLALGKALAWIDQRVEASERDHWRSQGGQVAEAELAHLLEHTFKRAI